MWAKLCSLMQGHRTLKERQQSASRTSWLARYRFHGLNILGLLPLLALVAVLLDVTMQTTFQRQMDHQIVAKNKPINSRALSEKKGRRTEKGAEFLDFPQLGPDHSPDSPSWNNSVAICAAMYMENVTDIREWVLYHRWVGVEHFYLYENGRSPEPPQSIVEGLKDFIEEGVVTVKAEPKPSGQLTIYDRCIHEHHSQYSWLAFIDLDEYIAIREDYRKEPGSLRTFLKKFKNEAGLVINWVNFGSSGREVRPPEGGVMRHYRHCQKRMRMVVKTIANTYYLLHAATHPHNFLYRNNRQSVLVNGEAVAFDDEQRPDCDPYDTTRVECRRHPPVTGKKISLDSIALYHFMIKSRADYATKLERGKDRRYRRVDSFFDDLDAEMTAGGMCSALVDVADLCCPLDTPSGLKQLNV